MTNNISTTPYIIQINEPMQTIRLSEELNNLGIRIDPHTQELTTLGPINNPQILIESTETPIENIPRNFNVVRQEEQPCIVQIVYPQDLSLSPAQNALKRGRPKKKKQEDTLPNGGLMTPKVEVTNTQIAARTRSGRLVKLPKHIQRDFKQIDISTDEQEVQLSDFKRCEEKENSKIEFAKLHTKKRVISAQYKCPKCLKAYLGKNKMIQHLKKYPDHGPLPEGYQEFNFDVWNYLFDITQKCKSGQRGIKFCEELSNLLHNVQLLKSALFKTVTDNKNCVHIDKVLGNAIGLAPGKYKFDENELYKDVTVLKLITNSDFFKPHENKQNNDNTITKDKIFDDVQLGPCENKRRPEIQSLNDDLTVIDINQDNQRNHIGSTNVVDSAIKNSKDEENVYNFSAKTDQDHTSTKVQQDNPELVDHFSKKMDVDSQIPLHSDLLTDNLLLQSLPNPRHSDEELMLTNVDNGSNLLDNSTSSDEVMNVDQFVNERFKKIIEPDIELNNTALNLDLPSLELFQFHTS